MNNDFKETYKRRLIFKYGTIIGLILIFGFRMSFMNLTNKYDPLVSMSLADFGYDEELTPSSRFSYEFNYDQYYHFLQDSNGMRMQIEVRAYSTEQGSLYAYEYEWKELKEYEQELHGRARCTECTIMPNDKADVYEYLVELDNTQWQSELAYAIYDYHKELPENGYYEYCVMLLRGKYMYRITFTESFKMTDENISVIVDYYDEFESVFERLN